MAVAPHALTGDAVRARIQGKRADIGGTVFKYALMAGLAITLALLISLIWSQVTRGWPILTDRGWDFVTSKYSSLPTRAGILQGITGTVTIALFVVGIAIPVGIGAALYLEEYAAKSRLTRFIDVNIRNLAGVPSVVYGILGLAIFARALKDITGGASVMSAGLTLAILVMPIVIITSAEAIRSVPQSLREGGYGVGATRWEVVRHNVLPYAAPGILTGTVLALARALGEAAPLLLVGAVSGFLGGGKGSLLDPGQLDERFTALPMIITTWAGRPQEGFRALTAAAIMVLLAVVLLFNATAILLRNHFEKKRG
jgi:phosphate transport system permease protein